MSSSTYSENMVKEPTYQEVFHVNLLWENRYWIVMWMGSFSSLVALICVLFFLFLEPTDSVSCQITTNSGIVKDEMPVNDIVSTTVINLTYDGSTISEYLDPLQFKDSVIIQKNTKEVLNFIDLQYANYLKPNMQRTGTDFEYYRSAFEKAKAQVLSSASLSIYFIPVDHIKVPIPLCADTLTKLLSNWVKFCVENHGYKPYSYEMVGVDLLRDMDINKDEPFILFNELRNLILNLVNSAQSIANQPGISFQQSPSGTYIKTILIQLTNLTNIQLKPLGRFIRQGQLYHDPLVVKTYIDEILYRLSNEKERHNKCIEMLEDTMVTYSKKNIRKQADGQTTISGAVSMDSMDSFVDGFISLAKEGKESKYRQQTSDKILTEGINLLTAEREVSYYTSFDPAAVQPTDMQAISGGSQEELWKIFRSGFDSALAEARRLQKELLALDEANRKKNINPQSLLYSIGPVIVTSGSFPLKKVAIMAMVSMALFLFFICFMLIMSEQMRGNEL